MAECEEDQSGEMKIYGRVKLPAPMSKAEFSVWSFLRQCIGKELSKITMPLVFNEPISFLQRVAEYMEYSELIDQADKEADEIKRMELVCAFAVSASASNWDRVGKPFNPLLGETYELRRPNFTLVCEQVSHHPPVSAFHAESPVFRFYGAIGPKLRFWGKSVEVQPRGFVTLELLRHNEVYYWQNVNCTVHNIIIGKLWVEHSGHMRITKMRRLGSKPHRDTHDPIGGSSSSSNGGSTTSSTSNPAPGTEGGGGHHSPANLAVTELIWRPCGWFGRELHRVEGDLKMLRESSSHLDPASSGHSRGGGSNKKMESVRSLYGKWTEALFSVEPDVWHQSGGVAAPASASLSGAAKQHQRASTSEDTNGSSSSASQPTTEEDPKPTDTCPCDLHLPGQRLLWCARPRPPDSSQFYNFTYYAIMLNELTPELANRGPGAYLPPTDCRFRPDIRQMEEGNLDGASFEKNRLEEIQRVVRKTSRKPVAGSSKRHSLPPAMSPSHDANSSFRSVWFRPYMNPYSKKEDWIFTGEYWKRDWAQCPIIF